MKDLLLIIDLQQSFINENTKYIIEKIEKIIPKYKNVVFTRFINSENNICYKKLDYKGCLTEEDKKIVIATGNGKIIDKEIYTAYSKELQEYIEENNISKIYLCGIDIDCCVLKTAFDLFENNYEVYILKDLCASTLGEERKQNAIEILARNIGKERII